jgi:hypothetical protein
MNPSTIFRTYLKAAGKMVIAPGAMGPETWKACEQNYLSKGEET